jgi:hypothetical protein
MNVDDDVTSSLATIGLLLRRSIRVSLRYSTTASLPIAVGITQSEAKGRTVQLSYQY